MVYKPVEGFRSVVSHRPFEEWSPRFTDAFYLDKTESGILTARWHTEGREMDWGPITHRGIGQLCMDVHQDPDIEVLILGGYGQNYMTDWDPPVSPRGGLTLEERYDLEYYDGCRTIEALVGLEQPTIGVINGPGYHTEYAVLCDVTLIAEGAIISDPHFMLGGVAGDGVQIAWREAMGLKRYNYALLTNELITAEKAVEYGLANEVVPQDRIYDRAREIAEEIAAAPRVTRAITTQILRAPWRKAIAWELRHGFGSEMFAAVIHDVNHENVGKWNSYLDKIGVKKFR